MKIHHFDVEFADKNGLSGVKEFVSALIIVCIGTIVPAVLAPLGIISYVVMFLIMVVTVIIVAILIKKYGVINKATMSVLIEDNEELYYLMITPDFHSATVPKDLTSLIAGPTATFIENKMDEEIGKWLLDISKYIITAYILSQMFGKDNDSWWSFIGAVLLAVLLFALGYYLIKKGKDKNKKGK